MDVNVNGVLFTAQAAGQQMARFGNGGSIVLIASMSGSITNKVRTFFSLLLFFSLCPDLSFETTSLLR
jgi:NAD(P)-dependent dehydrogenase (short-subunit alcohol dehydrogenase family)